MNFIAHNSQGQYTALIIFHRKQNWNHQKAVSLHTDTLIHLQLAVIQSAQSNSTAEPRTAVSPASSMQFFLHGMTAMYYPPLHCLSTTSVWKQCIMQCIHCTPLLDTVHIGPGPQPNCGPVALLWTLISSALCICTARINVSSCYIIVRTRCRHQQQTRCNCIVTL